MDDNACKAVPLVEQLRSVPTDAVLRIDTPNALGCMDTRSVPVGRLCHEAAAALDAATTASTTGSAVVPASRVDSDSEKAIEKWLQSVDAQAGEEQAHKSKAGVRVLDGGQR